MYYGALKKCDIANGAGVRVTLFVSGCTNHCPDCFHGRPFTHETETEIFRELDKPFISGLTVLGGEPFEPRNQRDLLPFLREIRRRYPRKNIWCFTGFRLEDELLQDGSYPRCEVTDDLLRCIASSGRKRTSPSSSGAAATSASSICPEPSPPAALSSGISCADSPSPHIPYISS